MYFKILDKSIPEDDIVTHTTIPFDKTQEIIKSSRCILDTDRESQTGTTPRLIWALAHGKKIITTNRNIKNMEFYSPNQIMIIDRNKPYIPLSFILDTLPSDYSTPSLNNLRIDNWVKLFLEK